MGCWLGLRTLKTLNFYFCKVIKKLIERIFAKKFARNYEKIILVLWTSDAWSMRWSSNRPSILYWRLSDFNKETNNFGGTVVIFYIKDFVVWGMFEVIKSLPSSTAITCHWRGIRQPTNAEIADCHNSTWKKILDNHNTEWHDCLKNKAEQKVRCKEEKCQGIHRSKHTACIWF